MFPFGLVAWLSARRSFRLVGSRHYGQLQAACGLRARFDVPWHKRKLSPGFLGALPSGYSTLPVELALHLQYGRGGIPLALVHQEGMAAGRWTAYLLVPGLGLLGPVRQTNS